MFLTEWLSARVFSWVHRNNLVYNTCWEDPRLDRVALELGPQDTVLVITSAGCNALDYALAGPAKVYTVDMNPRQNALLELKLSGIRHLEFDDFFAMFGHGQLAGAEQVYQARLRESLSPWAQRYWDRKIKYFGSENRRGSFYFRGTSGTFAWAINRYLNRRGLRPWITKILAARSLAEQREIYEKHLRDRFWSRIVRFAMQRDAVLSLLGVPRAQRNYLESQYQGGLLQFMRDCLEAVFAEMPLADNYFWRVYLTGRYTPECCPEYLKPENFRRLKDGLAERISVNTDTIQGFLEKHDVVISRFVLLDHMDWLTTGKRFPLLEQEWQAIVERAARPARLLWRSGGQRGDFVNEIRVCRDKQWYTVGDLLTYHPDLAADLHRRCRVHTYGCMAIADLKS